MRKRENLTKQVVMEIGKEIAYEVEVGDIRKQVALIFAGTRDAFCALPQDASSSTAGTVEIHF